jgi:DNA polymerase I-like protein with 3'-5' exonuclease and polymerase domains
LDIHIEDARHLIRSVHELFPQAMAFMDEIAQRAAEDGRIETPTGRILHCEDSKNARRVMANHFFQSLTSDANIFTYAALIRKCNRVVPLIHIHDGYVLETYDHFAEEDSEFVRDILEENPLADFGLELNLRCSIEIADHWIG